MIVLTGKSGAGKTSLLKMLNFKNTYYADDYVKNHLYKKGHPFFEIITTKFPSIKNNDEIDISKLRNILFSDKQKLKEINDLIFPYISKWLRGLPNKSIIEMATYINLEKMYSGFFKKVILVVRDNYDLSKFGFQPIKNKKIKYDFLIKNKTLEESVVDLRKYLIFEKYL